MPISYYRYIRDTDDGCGINQCLVCGATWEWRGGSGTVRFCMYCGVEFKGLLETREQGTPRWKYEYQKRHGDNALYKLERALADCPHRPETYWVIEERTFRTSDGSLLQDWHERRSLYHRHGISAYEAFEALQEQRKLGTPDDPEYDPQYDLPWDYSRDEYRLRRKTTT